MKFTHDFQADLSTLLAELDSGRPFAFNRFADGELAILEGRDIPTADGWSSKVDDRFRERLLAALRYRDDDYYLGLSCPCCAPDDFQKLLALAGRTADDPQVTTSNVFVNGNYDAWLRYLCDGNGRRAIGIRPQGGRNIVNEGTDEFIKRAIGLIIEGSPKDIFIVAAGPVGKIIVHEAWSTSVLRGYRRIIDVGSTLEPMLLGQSTRSYHDPSHPNRKKICQWVK